MSERKEYKLGEVATLSTSFPSRWQAALCRCTGDVGISPAKKIPETGWLILFRGVAYTLNPRVVSTAVTVVRMRFIHTDHLFFVLSVIFSSFQINKLTPHPNPLPKRGNSGEADSSLFTFHSSLFTFHSSLTHLLSDIRIYTQC